MKTVERICLEQWVIKQSGLNQKILRWLQKNNTFIQKRLKEISLQLHWKERKEEKAASLLEKNATNTLSDFS